MNSRHSCPNESYNCFYVTKNSLEYMNAHVIKGLLSISFDSITGIHFAKLFNQIHGIFIKIDNLNQIKINTQGNRSKQVCNSYYNNITILM